ncbi:MAG: hypothetical protein ABSG04_06830 [Verrucomicrobiota bacterium]
MAPVIQAGMANGVHFTFLGSPLNLNLNPNLNLNLNPPLVLED